MAEEKNQSQQLKDEPEKKEAQGETKVEPKKEEAPKDDKKTQEPSVPAKEEPIEVPEKFKKLVEQIESLSVLDLAELVKILEKKFGVSAVVPVSVAVAAQAPGAGVEEKTSFNVELTASGGQKINVIKVIREVTGLGLKEAKDLVDGAPKIVKEGVKKEEAQELKKKLEAAGATVELK